MSLTNPQPAQPLPNNGEKKRKKPYHKPGFSTLGTVAAATRTGSTAGLEALVNGRS